MNAGPERSFTTETGGEAGLPDSREWELVSPPEKNGAKLSGTEEKSYLQAAAAGDGIVYPASSPTEAAPRGNGDPDVQVLARRSSSGWSNVDLAIPHSFPTGPTARQAYRAFSSDLSLGVLQPAGHFEPALSSEATEETPYLRDSATGAFTPLVTPANDNTGLPFGEEESEAGCLNATCGPEFRGGSPDLSHLVLAPGINGRAVPLLAGTTGGLYEWSAGKLAFVSEPPPGAPELGGGAELGNEKGTVLAHAVSDDGSRVFWTQKSAVSRAPLLFMRDLTRGVTIEIGAGEASFEGANAQGTLVFHDGRECEIPLAGVLECKPVLDKHGEELDDGTVLATSEDGSWVYFQEKEGLYVRHGSGEAKQIATSIGHIKSPNSANLSPQRDPWRASPDGQWFAFMSDSPLAGYDNHDAVTGALDVEVYLYDESAESLVCASCEPTGARPHGTPTVDLQLAAYGLSWEASLAASVPGWGPYANERALYDPRFVSDSGRLFFNAVGGLVPKDVNEQVDTYELEPAGVGSCTTATQTGTVVYSPAADGCVALISSGESPEESVFEDASVTGEDVFFLSSSRLSTLDLDGSLSLWDAHACTSVSPCLPTPPTQPPSCSTEASCKASSSPQPSTFGAPASATFHGSGNLASVPSPAGGSKVRRVTRAQKLARALRACGRKRSRHGRKICEASVRRRYGAGKLGVSRRQGG